MLKKKKNELKLNELYIHPKMCDPILVTLLKMQPHYSQSSRENATPSSGTSPLASYREVPPPDSKITLYMYMTPKPTGLHLQYM